VADAPEDAQAKFARTQYELFQASADKMRQRADTTAKAVGALGTTALAGIGVSEFADLFPFHDSTESIVAALFLLLGFAAMASAIAFFTYRLWTLNEPIAAYARSARMELNAQEKKAVDDIYNEVARLNDTPSLLAYQARGLVMGRIASRLGSQAGSGFSARSTVILGEVQATLARARALVVRMRTKTTLTDDRAKSMAIVFAAGLLAFALAADYLESVRTDEVSVAKSCADASEAGVTALPSVCDRYRVTKAPEPTPAQAAASAVQSLGVALATCDTAVRQNKTEPGTCVPLKAAYAAATK
jgi:hypothetical protein